jgi:hypothetical protein
MFGWLKKVASYLHKDAVAVDQAANVFAGGKPDETISSRAQRAADRGNPVGKVISGGLDLIQKDHGHKAMGGDLRRAEAVEKLEEDGLKK